MAEKKNYSFGTDIYKRFDPIKEMLYVETIPKPGDIFQDHLQEIVDFKKQAVKDCLIELGWTPPIKCEECGSNSKPIECFCEKCGAWTDTRNKEE